MTSHHNSTSENIRHKAWVKSSHWIITVSFLALVFSGFVIFMCHPRLYWGEVGNDLTPALFELPISRNYRHGGWEKATAFYDKTGSVISASRTYEIFNENGWGRSLHFLAAWFLFLTGLVYLFAGIFSGHFWRHIVPKAKEFSLRLFWNDFKDHLRMRIPPATSGPHYGLLQKMTYMGVIFLVLPLIVVTGLTMSPRITASYPLLLDIFGGIQSARTIHFFASGVLVLFLLAHLTMIIKSGFKKHITAMTIGK